MGPQQVQQTPFSEANMSMTLLLPQGALTVNPYADSKPESAYEDTSMGSGRVPGAVSARSPGAQATSQAKNWMK